MPVRVLIVDSDQRHAAVARAALEEAGFSVAGGVTSLDEPALAGEVRGSEVALVDVSVAGGDLAAMARRLRALAGSSPVLVAMAEPHDAPRAAEFVAAGAMGYVVKGNIAEVVEAARAAAEGSAYLSREVTGPVLDEMARLYERERGRNDELEALVQQLQDLSVTDWLTGVRNHGFFYERLAEELDRALRHRRPLSAIMADLDDFKVINDTRGHGLGDRVLKEVAAVMADTVRSADIVCRVGGEEFAVILPETDAAGAKLVAERVREQVAALAVRGVGKVTVSLGVAAVPEHAVDRDELVEAADRALYLAKRAGKNRVRVAGDVASIVRNGSAPRGHRGHVVDLIVRALRLRSAMLAVHAERTSEVAVSLGARVGLTPGQLERLRIAGLVQGVGMVGIPDTVLHGEGPLDDHQRAPIAAHPKRGFELVSGLVHPEVAEAVLTNHEWWDGSGYPRGLRGAEIPLLGRILHLADAYAAMREDRPYRAALDEGRAVAELRGGAGTQFDPDLVRALTDLLVAPPGPEPVEGRAAG